MENCASGGLRADLSLTKWCARVNRSDDEDVMDGLKLNEGFTLVNIPKSAGGACHLRHSPNGMTMRTIPMKRMAYTSMLGGFSVGYDLAKLSEDETEELKKYVEIYKEVRDITQLGDMYLLSSVYDKDAPAVIWQFVSKDKEKSVIFVFANNKGDMGWLEAIKLDGLKADKKYNISLCGVDNKTFDFSPTSGDTLMKMGLAFNIERMLDSDSTFDCFAVILD